MATWKYRTVCLTLGWDDKKKAWVCKTRDTAYGSIDEALDAYGSMGWGLVSVVGKSGSLPGVEYEEYRSFFKASA